MPFCTRCGNQVGSADVFCGKCGARQREGAASAVRTDFLSGLNPRTASLLCYVPIVGWIACIIMLAAPRFQHDRTVRFHAFQGLYLFVVWLLVSWVVSPFVNVAGGVAGAELHLVKSVLHLAVLCAWIFMLIKTSRGALLDTVAIIEGLKSGQIGYLGLDVYEEEEQIFFEDRSGLILGDDVFARLLTFPNVIITGHQAFFTREALLNIAGTTIDNITKFENNQPLEKLAG